MDSCCSLKPKGKPLLQGAARWSEYASAPGLCPADVDSHSSVSGPLPGLLAPETHHLKNRQGRPTCQRPLSSTSLRAPGGLCHSPMKSLDLPMS
jgi:hypothetical protein